MPHSPAPWRTITRSNQLGVRLIQVIDAQSRVVTKFEPPYSAIVRTVTPPLTSQQVADAGLIAAAPELLAALKAVLAATSAPGFKSITPEADKFGFSDALTAARQAVEKAGA